MEDHSKMEDEDEDAENTVPEPKDLEKKAVLHAQTPKKFKQEDLS